MTTDYEKLRALYQNGVMEDARLALMKAYRVLAVGGADSSHSERVLKTLVEMVRQEFDTQQDEADLIEKVTEGHVKSMWKSSEGDG